MKHLCLGPDKILIYGLARLRPLNKPKNKYIQEVRSGRQLNIVNV